MGRKFAARRILPQGGSNLDPQGGSNLEVYDREGRHLESVDPKTGEQTKPAVPGRTNENVR
jgi:hypothetical protein